MADTVELHAAWRWDCTECGVENWVRGVHLENEHLTQRQLNVLGEAEWWVMYPAEVECKTCKSGFVVAQGLKDIQDTESDDA